MGFRFRRTIRLAPGIRFNLGLRRSSVSIGGHGASLNVGVTGRHHAAHHASVPPALVYSPPTDPADAAAPLPWGEAFRALAAAIVNMVVGLLIMAAVFYGIFRLIAG